MADPANQAILNACAGLPILAVGGLSMTHPLIDALMSAGHPVGTPPVIHAQLRDPKVLRSLAKTAGVLVPPTFESSEPNESVNAVTRSSSTRWLTKRTRSSGGLGVRWWNAGGTIARDECRQQWIPGRTFGVTYLSDGQDVRLIGVCRSRFTRIGALPFVYAGSCGPIKLDPLLVGKLEKLGGSSVASLALTGVFNIDVVIDRDRQIWLLEMNPRWSGSTEIVERSLAETGVLGAPSSLLALAVNRQLLNSATATGCSTRADDRVWLKRIVYAKDDQRFWFNKYAQGLSPFQTLHDIPPEGTLIKRGEPVMTLITMMGADRRNDLIEYRRMRSKIEHGNR